MPCLHRSASVVQVHTLTSPTPACSPPDALPTDPNHSVMVAVARGTARPRQPLLVSSCPRVRLSACPRVVIERFLPASQHLPKCASGVLWVAHAIRTRVACSPCALRRSHPRLVSPQATESLPGARGLPRTAAAAAAAAAASPRAQAECRVFLSSVSVCCPHGCAVRGRAIALWPRSSRCDRGDRTAYGVYASRNMLLLYIPKICGFRPHGGAIGSDTPLSARFQRSLNPLPLARAFCLRPLCWHHRSAVVIRIPYFTTGGDGESMLGLGDIVLPGACGTRHLGGAGA